MKNLFKILLIVVIAGAIGGYIYWQKNKKNIISNSIEKAIAKKTDSLYYIHYDSSKIDELNGNASFYNVVLQSDSTQKKLLSSTDSLPNALYNISVKEITARGIDMTGFLQKQDIAAKKILLVKPVIQIINTGADKPKPFTMNDTMDLYRKILGRFESIKADTIQIVNGTLLITDKNSKPQTTLENINITIARLLIDSTKNYESIISYFIKDVRATVENIQLPRSKTGTRINIEKLDYNAAQKYLKVGAVRQYNTNNPNPFVDLKNIQVTGLNTDAFILQQRLIAGSITCDGGLITIYTSTNTDKANKGNKSIELSSDLIDQAQVGGIRLGGTKIVILSKSDPAAKPLILDNAKFTVLTPVKINEGTTVNNIINNAEWELSANGFSTGTKNGFYKISVGNFTINNVQGTANIKNFLVTPLLTEAQFVKQSATSGDQYNLAMNNISLSGIAVKKFFRTGQLDVANAGFQPVIKIFNDKTLAPDKTSKVGKYPHQSLVKLRFPIYIKVIKVVNGSVSYRERGEKSALIGNVFFSSLNGTISNVTNIPERIKLKNAMVLDASAKFLGEGRLTTQWQLPLNTNNGDFHMEGELKNMNALTLNKIIQPLAMASIKQGRIDKVAFTLDGTNTNAKGNILFLYHDLKLDILKKAADEKQLKKRGVITALANTLIKNQNRNNDNDKDVDYDRDVTKSFFNLVWKTVFTGVKKTAVGL